MAKMIFRLEALERKKTRGAGPQLSIIVNFGTLEELERAEEAERQRLPSSIQIKFKLQETP